MEKKIAFSRIQPVEFSALLKLIKDKNPDGIMLDLRLDEAANATGHRVDFRGTSVAQELRTRMTEGKIRNIPIVLWSVFRKLVKSYRHDSTSHDLFDAVYDKEKDVTDDPERVSRELIALHTGYTEIEQLGSREFRTADLLGIKENDVALLDPRFAEFLQASTKIPSHEIARSLLQTLIVPVGPLLDEGFVGARLGIDIPASSDWTKLLSKIDTASKYTGLFGEGWPRWWNIRLLSWWESLKGRPGKLQRTDAKQRVQFLKKHFGLSKLTPASVIDKGYAATFWTICQALGRPLDPANGLRIVSTPALPFHEPLYISIKAALERKHVANELQIDPLELHRFERLKNAKKAKKK